MADEVEVLEITDDARPTVTRSTSAIATGVNGSAGNARPTRPANLPDTPRRLFDLPEYAERYQPIFSTLEDVVYRDAHKFCLKPPYWERWTKEDYVELSHQLQLVDLRPIARKLNKPVEEVLHMYDGLVVGLLQDAGKANQRGMQTMKSWFELYKQSGTPMRSWTDNAVEGELENMTCQEIHLILETGFKGKVKLDELNKSDHAWIQENVVLANRQLLSGMADGLDVKYDTEDGLPPVDTKSLKRKAPPEPATPQPLKKARLDADPKTAPAKFVSTPPAPKSVLSAVTPLQQDPTPSKPPTTAVQSSQLQFKVSKVSAQRPAAAQSTDTPQGKPRQATPPAVSPAATRPATAVAPNPSLMVRLPVALLTIYRPWSSAGTIARLTSMTAAAVLLEEENTQKDVVLSRCALNEADKDWLNKAREDKLIPNHLWAALLSKTTTSADAFRLWTAEGILARAERLSRQSVQLLLLSDRSLMEIKPDDLSAADEAYLKEHFAAYEFDELYRESAEEVVQGSDADADAGAEDEDEDDEPDNDNQAPEDNLAASEVPSVRAAQSVVQEATGETTPVAEDSYEIITGAPIRSWSEAGFMANLIGIAKHVVFLRVEGEDGTRRLPMAEWSVDDNNWIKGYLVKEQRKVLSGRDRA